MILPNFIICDALRDLVPLYNLKNVKNTHFAQRITYCLPNLNTIVQHFIPYGSGHWNSRR